MSSVFQQIVLDKIQCTPAVRPRDSVNEERQISRDDSSKGLLVNLSASQSNRNIESFGNVLAEKTSGATTTITGVLGDYHNERNISVFRKGRIFVAANKDYVAADIGLGIQATDEVGKAQSVTTGGVGEILGGGYHATIGRYYVVDLNLPLD